MKSVVRWSQRPLADCGTLLTGGTPSRSEPLYWGGHVPWISAKSLKRFDVGDADERLTDAGAGVSTLVPPGSILFVVRGMSLAKEFRVGVAGTEVAFNQDLRALVPVPEVNGRYLARFLEASSQSVLGLVDEASHGTKRLTSDRFENISVPLPPLSEQRRIAAILDKADALRAMRRAAIAKLDTLSQSVFLDMFGDPATNPKRWPTISVKESLTIPLRNGLSPSKAGRISAEVLTLSAITGAGFDDLARKVSTFQTPPPAEQAVNCSDFLICRGNGNIRLVGRGQFPTRSMPEVTFPDTMIAARVSDQLIKPAFLAHVWNSNAVRHQIESLARTTNGTFKINQTMLEETAFIRPPLRLQSQFSDRIASVAEIGRRGTGSLVALNTLFASLQHRAFRGEL